MKRYLSLKDRIMGRPIVQCDICGFIDPWEFAENAHRWDGENEGYGYFYDWSYGANPNAHICPQCREALLTKDMTAQFYREVGFDE